MAIVRLRRIYREVKLTLKRGCCWLRDNGWIGRSPMPEPTDDPAPSRTEIERQLKRIIDHPLFRKTEKPAEVFRLLVNSAIDGERLIERQIRAHVFPDPPYDPGGTHVRTTVNTVRKLLRAYCRSDEAKDDSVIISLPVAKEGYPVIFRYNPNVAPLKLGTDLLKRLSPKAVREASEIFETILARHPDHFCANIAWIECLCVTAIFIPDPRPKEDITETALTRARQLVEENPADWRAYHILAVASLCAFHLDESFAAFSQAHSLDPAKPKMSLWMVILCLFDNTLEVEDHLNAACDHALALASTRVSDPLAWDLYGFCQYFRHDFEGAGKAFGFTRHLDAADWIACLGLALIALAIDRPEDALLAYNHMNRLLNDDVALMPCLGVLAATRAFRRREASSVESPPIQLPVFVGEAAKALEHSPEETKDWMQVAISLIDDFPPSAVLGLRIAYGCHHPLALLAHRWPLFDPLKGLDEFKLLLEQMGVSPDSQPVPPDESV
jgi:tetratricopeptide (TPR) repeat protein